MIEKAMENFILNATYSDVLSYKKQNKRPVVESYEENQWSYIVEIMLITIKSLKPSQVKDGNIVDYNRFKLELDLWKSYRHGMNKNLLYSMDENKYSGYFSEIDESVYARISVITLANQNWEIIKHEIMQNILFTTGNLEIILECLLLSKILFLKLNDKKLEYEDILSYIKQETINFSPAEIDLDRKDSKIEFERLRVSLITRLNGVIVDNKFPILRDCLNILESENNESIENQDNFFISGLIGVMREEVVSRQIKDIGFLENLCTYMVKLRKGRIALEEFKIEDYKIVDLFAYKEGETFHHSLLNTTQVIHKERRDDFEIAYMRTKTGIYRFVRKDKNSNQ